MKRNRIRCVRCVRLARLRIDHLFRVAVIRGYQRDASRRPNCFLSPSQPCVDVLASFDCLVELTGVSNHVRVGKVDDEYVCLALVNKTQDIVRDLESRHFRLKIVSSNLRRGHQQSLLAAKLLFRAPIEEIGDVGVLLGFGETKVFDAKTREHVGENGLVLARGKGDRQRNRDVVNREANEIDRRSIRNRKLVKTCDSQHSRDLARAVGTKVEKYYSVAILNGRYRLAALINDNYGFNKFVGHAALVRFFDRLDGIIGSLDRKSTRLNSSHPSISYAVFCL